MAAKCCWSMYCRVSARPRWSIARAEPRREREGKRADWSVVVAAVAGSGRVVGDIGYFRHPDRGFAALVDIAGRDLYGRIPGLAAAVPRLHGLAAIAEASGLRPAGGALRPHGDRNAVVGCAVERG